MSSTIPYEIPEIMYNGKRASGLSRYQSAQRRISGDLSSTYFHLPYLITSPLFSLGTPPVAASMIRNKVLMRPKTKMAAANTVRVGKLRRRHEVVSNAAQIVDRSRGVDSPLDQRSDQDGPDDLHGLVEPGKGPQLAEGLGRLEPVGGEGDDGPIEAGENG